MPREMEVRIVTDHNGSVILEQYRDGSWSYVGQVSDGTYDG